MRIPQDQSTSTMPTITTAGRAGLLTMDNSSDQHRQEMNFLANSENPKGTIYRLSH